MIANIIKMSREVIEAREKNIPIVALESTIITHGMPYPKNIEMAKKVENIIREIGAVPATIAIIKGILKVGLEKDEIEYLAKQEDVVKVSRRDIPVVVSKKLNGATTVASTMIIAALANIKVFVTGGIGGVHKKGEQTFDISADLQELSKTDVAVVCAGVKSILDIGLTLEYLETYGVPVLGYKVNEFPAFYTRKSGYFADSKLESAMQAAEVMKTKWDLGLSGGIVIANPIPKKYEMPSNLINSAIDSALKEADMLGLKGKAITPFLLDRIWHITEGQSLDSNIELVYDNARVGAEIAIEYNKL